MAAFSPDPPAAEFFAGIGLARLGMERAGCRVAWANDSSDRKAEMYDLVHPASGPGVVVGDVWNLGRGEVPSVEVAWASFPCIDVSLSGNREGIDGRHSSAFWGFARALEGMRERPELVVVENVPGLLTSRGGRDAARVVQALNAVGYAVDVIVLDALRFLPQSRARVFLAGRLHPPQERAEAHISALRPPAVERLLDEQRLTTFRHALPAPPPLVQGGLTDLAEQMGEDDPRWWPQERAERAVAGMGAAARARFGDVQDVVRRHGPGGSGFSAGYRRTRGGSPRWEFRPDDVAGCLRAVSGGSSRQAMALRGWGRPARMRWMTPVEYARLMGAPEQALSLAALPEAWWLHALGDAVCVPAVEWLVKALLAA